MKPSFFIISEESKQVFLALSLLHQFDSALFDVMCPDGEPITETEIENFKKAQKNIDELNDLCNQFLLKSVNANVQSAPDIV